MVDETFPGAIVKTTDAVLEPGILVLDPNGEISFTFKVEHFKGRTVPGCIVEAPRVEFLRVRKASVQKNGENDG